MGVDTGRLRVVETVETPERGKRSEAQSGSRRKRRPAAVPESAPESAPEQRTPGAYIKHQRKRRGMSLDQLAVVTKIPRAQLELLEADRFEELPGMVFGKGFLRCCARALELDPDTVLGLLYAREREQLRARRRDASSVSTPSRASGPEAGRRWAPRKRSRTNPVHAWVAEWLSRLPSARIVMWVVVALIVALIVLIAFTLASSQADAVIRS
jgi:cytoskeletal protein RodZ